MPSSASGKPKKPKKVFRYDEPKRLGGRKVPLQATHDKPFMNFFASLPDFEEFKTALAVCEDPRFNCLLEAILDPRNQNTSYVRLARLQGITLPEINDYWRNYNHHRGMVRMVAHLPEVMEDVAKDSKSTADECPRCSGSGLTKAKTICVRCNGQGTIRVAGDNNSRQILFEALGYTKKHGPLVAIQQNFEGGSLVDQSSREIQKILQGAPELE